jgi:alanyl-tRNA synthetase
MEKDRDSCRVKFLAGNRALTQLTNSLQRDAALSVSLSVPPKLFASTVDKIMMERRDNDKKMKEMQIELASLLGRSIAENFLNGKHQR